MADTLGKQAEHKIQQWLDTPESGYCFDRIPDQLSGLWGSKNICDFTLYKYPYKYYIESKSTYADRFDFSMISDYQLSNMYNKSKIIGVFSIIVVLFATHKRAFLLNIQDIKNLIDCGKKSLNIKKLDSWNIPNVEIPTVQNNRKVLLDYSGDFQELVCKLLKNS